MTGRRLPRDRGPLGRLIRTRRKAKGYSQRKLAQLTGLGVGAIGAYEQGRSRPPAGKLARLCIALGLEPDAVSREIAEAQAIELRKRVERLRAERTIPEPFRNQRAAAGQHDESRDKGWDLACGIWKDKIVVTARFERAADANEIADGMVRLVRKLLPAVVIPGP